MAEHIDVIVVVFLVFTALFNLLKIGIKYQHGYYSRNRCSKKNKGYSCHSDSDDGSSIDMFDNSVGEYELQRDFEERNYYENY